MKNQCSKCRQGIENWDFYVQSEGGKICSSCLVEQELSGREFTSLFKVDAAQKEAGQRLSALQGLEELGLRDLEQEPLFAVHTGV